LVQLNLLIQTLYESIQEQPAPRDCEAEALGATDPRRLEPLEKLQLLDDGAERRINKAQGSHDRPSDTTAASAASPFLV